MGPNMFSFMASRLDTYAGLAIFTGYVAYDTHLAMSMYESGYADHLLCGLNLALDFWGIFMRVMQILSIFSSSD